MRAGFDIGKLSTAGTWPTGHGPPSSRNQPYQLSAVPKVGEHQLKKAFSSVKQGRARSSREVNFKSEISAISLLCTLFAIKLEVLHDNSLLLIVEGNINDN